MVEEYLTLFFSGSPAEIGGWRCAKRMEGVGNVLKVNELNNSVKESEYQESSSGKYVVWEGGDV